MPYGRKMTLTHLDKDTVDFSHLIGNNVLVDNLLLHCYGVEHARHGFPWIRGERIGLLLEELP